MWDVGNKSLKKLLNVPNCFRSNLSEGSGNKQDRQIMLIYLWDANFSFYAAPLFKGRGTVKNVLNTDQQRPLCVHADL